MGVLRYVDIGPLVRLHLPRVYGVVRTTYVNALRLVDYA